MLKGSYCTWHYMLYNASQNRAKEDKIHTVKEICMLQTQQLNQNLSGQENEATCFFF